MELTVDWADFCAQIPDTKTVSIEAYTGTSGLGDLFAAAVSVSPCVVEHARRDVKVQTGDAAGRIVISSTTIYCPPGTVAPAKSKMTLPNGTVTRVLTASTLDDHGLELPSHVELLLE